MPHNRSRVQLIVVRTLLAGTLVMATFCAAVLMIHLTEGSAVRPPQPVAEAFERYHYYYTGASANKIALTFDDGPVAAHTETIAAVLEKHHAPATFFFIGNNILAHPELVKNISDRGFDIGDHSMTHQYSVHDSKERMARELNGTSYLIERITGKAPKYYRPPFLLGIGVDPTVNPYIPLPTDMQWALELGYVPVGIDIDSLDWLANDPAQVLRGTISAHSRGHIVLFHDEKITADALDSTMSYLEGKGYTFTTLDEMLEPPTHVVLAHTLTLGDTSASTDGDVSKLQWFLYTHGYLDAYAMTGTFDAQTHDALGRFQVLQHIVDPFNVDPTVYGVAGAATRAAIDTVSLKDVPPPVESHTAFYTHISHAVGTFAIYAFSWANGILKAIVELALALLILRLIVILLLSGLHAAGWRPKKIKALPPHVPVTVIIPAYNEEENIAATIETVALSHYNDLDIIVVNDGSHDATQEIAERTALKFPQRSIKIISVPNGGKAKALMLGVQAATTDIVITMDGDSIFTPQTVGELAKRFGDPLVAAVAGKVYTASMSSIIDRMQALEYFIGQNIEKRMLAVVNGISVVPGPVGAWRKQLLLDAGGFVNDTLVEDQDMTLALIARGHKVVYEPRAIAYTETPRTINDFLKQRYRWIYGTLECFYKHGFSALKAVPQLLMGDTRKIGIIVTFVNIFFYSIVLPLTYPIIDALLVYGVFTGTASLILAIVAAFTLFDMAYALLGVMGEKYGIQALIMVPFTRIIYRQLLYYTAIRSMVRALEGRHLGWNKVSRSGEAQKLFASANASAN